MRGVKDKDPIEQMAAARDQANVDRTLWQRQLKQNAKGGFKGDLDNVMQAIELAPDLVGIVAFDEFAQRLVKVKLAPWDRPKAVVGGVWTDNDDVQLQRWLQRHGVPVAGVNTVHDAVLASARRYDSLRDYLTPLVWDKRKRVGSWLSTYLGTEANIYTDAVGKRWITSAVARALRPGCQADHVLALEGPQGALKSSAVRVLGGEWTKEDLSAIGTKDAVVELQGAWLIELSELAAMARSEVEQIKSFISRRIDKFRAPYGRHAIEQPRRCVFVATTNDDRWLKDTTGNRRFWPVKVGTIDLEALTRDRDQLWAEAVKLYKGGTPWHITEPDVLRMAEAEQSARVEDDPWTPLLKNQLDARKPVKTAQLLSAIGLDDAKLAGGHAKRVGGIMRRWGWASHVDKSGGERDVWWSPRDWTPKQLATWFAEVKAKQAKVGKQESPTPDGADSHGK